MGKLWNRLFGMQRKPSPEVTTAKPMPTPPEYDSRTEASLASLTPRARAELRALVAIADKVAERKGCEVRAISGLRTYAEQDALYAKGRRGVPGEKRVTKARAGFSSHNFGTAIDLGTFRGGRYLDDGTQLEQNLASSIYAETAREAKAAGLQVDWGGDWKSFKDEPHFEFRTGMTLAEMRELKENGQQIA